MKMNKKVSVVGAWARKEPYEYEGHLYDPDLQDGDLVKFLDDGTITQGEYGEQQVFSIHTRNGARNIALNQSSINVLVDEWGEESMNWVGREAKVLLKKGIFGGKKSIACYLVTADWFLDEWGDLQKGIPRAAEQMATTTFTRESAPQMPQSVVDAQNLQPGDVPF